MNKRSPMDKKVKGSLLLLSALLMFSLTGLPALAQEWVVSEEEAALTNPREYILENVEKGKVLYQINCKSCHGDPGKGNFLPLVPPPPDVISEQMHANSGGALYSKITTGKGGMPQFETVLSDDERWDLVNFIMNYHPDRVAVLIELPPVKALLVASVGQDSTSVEIFAEYEDESGSMQILKNTPVYIAAKRTFGSLPIGEVTTDDQGKASFTVPATTIGNEKGLVDISISLGEGFEADTLVLGQATIGAPKDNETHIRKGVLWSTNDKMPFWLQFGFPLLVLGAWLTIAYVILQIVKIARQSKES